MACPHWRLVRQGRLGRLEELNLSNNKGVTDNGFISLARAIEASGLPRLQHIRISKLDKMKVTTLGFGAIAYPVTKGSPQLKSINLECNKQKAASLRTTVEGMLREADGECRNRGLCGGCVVEKLHVHGVAVADERTLAYDIPFKVQYYLQQCLI